MQAWIITGVPVRDPGNAGKVEVDADSFPEALQNALLTVAGRPATQEQRTIELLLRYGQAKFGDEWWPGNARNWIGDAGRELEFLLDPGSAAQADAAAEQEWEVVASSVMHVDAGSAPQAAARAAAAWEQIISDKYYQADPNAYYYVRRACRPGPWAVIGEHELPALPDGEDPDEYAWEEN